MTLWMNWNACSQAATSRLTDTLLEAWVRPWLRITTSSNCCRPQLGVTMVRATDLPPKPVPINLLEVQGLQSYLMVS